MMLEVAKEETQRKILSRVRPSSPSWATSITAKLVCWTAIRSEDVAAGEAGGITQHIGAYKIKSTSAPSFSSIRQPRSVHAHALRGAKLRTSVVLVVAAAMASCRKRKKPSITARAANVPIIVAINKVDKPEAQPERVKRQLSDLGFDACRMGRRQSSSKSRQAKKASTVARNYFAGCRFA